MKVAYCSDLHLEFTRGDPYGLLPQEFLDNTEKADVLILAGDTADTTYLQGTRAPEFFAKLGSSYPRVLYVMGNHEHYNGDIAKTGDILRNLFKGTNITLLDNEGVTIEGVRFFGGTKWTDLKKADPLVIFDVNQSMNDYRCILNSNEPVHYWTYDENGNKKAATRVGRLTPGSTMHAQRVFMAALENDLASHPESEYFVISHHSPSMLMVQPEFVGDFLNAAYHDTLEDFILSKPQIKNWVFGHTHGRDAKFLGDCELLLNARGYLGEQTFRNFSLTFKEI